MVDSPMDFIPVVILGLAAGILSGLFGLAGGTLLVPGLMVFSHLSQTSSIATSLAGNILPVGILGVLHYWRAGHVRLKAVVPLTFFLALGGWLGSMAALDVPPFWHSLSYGIFMAALSLRFLLYKSSGIDEDALPPAPLWGMALVGLAAGLCSGLFGIGGGALIVPLLMECFRFSQVQASATSLAALLLPFSLPAVLNYHSSGQVSWIHAGLLALGLFFGAIAGAKIHTRTPQNKIQKAYGLYLAVIGLGFTTASFLKDLG